MIFNRGHVKLRNMTGCRDLAFLDGPPATLSRVACLAWRPAYQSIKGRQVFFMYKLFADDHGWAVADGRRYQPGVSVKVADRYVFRCFTDVASALLLDAAWNPQELRVVLREVRVYGCRKVCLGGRVIRAHRVVVGKVVPYNALSFEERLGVILKAAMACQVPHYWRRWAGNWLELGREAALAVLRRLPGDRAVLVRLATELVVALTNPDTPERLLEIRHLMAKSFFIIYGYTKGSGVSTPTIGGCAPGHQGGRKARDGC
jgi:hypothetical protein